MWPPAYAGACAIKSLNSVTNAPSFGPGLLRSGLARSTRTSCASVPSTLIVSSMNSRIGIARGSLLLPSRSVSTHGGAISSTLTDVSLSLYRCESANECSAAFVVEYRVRQEIGGRRSRSSLGTCLRQHPSNA